MLSSVRGIVKASNITAEWTAIIAVNAKKSGGRVSEKRIDISSKHIIKVCLAVKQASLSKFFLTE